MTKLAILDPSLKSFNGHFLTYDNAVAQGVAPRGISSLFFASADVREGLPARGEIIPTFRYGLEHSFFPGPFMSRSRLAAKLNERLLGQKFLEDLDRSLTPDRLGKNPILFLHTTTHQQIPALIEWTAKNRSLSPTVVIFLRYAPSPNPYYPLSGGAEGYKKALDSILAKGVEKYVRLVTDSDILAEEYGLLTSLPIHVLPIPHTSAALPPFSAESPLTLSYLGNARATKGFQYLPYLADGVREALDSGAWRAEFQANVMFARDTESVLAVQLLRQKNVTLHEQELAAEEYEGLLHRSALIVVPYQLLYYYAQTSGVLCEALAASKAVVVPRGTWMARQIKGRGVGEAFLPGDALSLAESTRKAMRNIDRLLENARAFREEWVSYHSPESFAQALLDLV